MTHPLIILDTMAITINKSSDKVSQSIKIFFLETKKTTIATHINEQNSHVIRFLPDNEEKTGKLKNDNENSIKDKVSKMFCLLNEYFNI